MLKMVNLHKLVQRVINEEVWGSDLRLPEQVGGLSDWEEGHEIPLSKLREMSRHEQRLEVEPESPLMNRLRGAGIFQTQQRSMDEERLFK